MIHNGDMNERIRKILEEIPEDRELMGKTADLMMEDLMLSEEERASPDRFGCDCCFVENFLTEEMQADFPLIVKDFLKHEGENLEEYAAAMYADTDMAVSDPETGLYRNFLNLIFCAYRKGSPYAAALLRFLYRTYYKKEYQQLKRFTRLSKEDVASLAGEGDDCSCSAARILTMGELLGIPADPDCSLLYLFFNRTHEKEMEEGGLLFWSVWSREELQRAEEEITGLFTEEEISKAASKNDRLLGDMLEYLEYPRDYADVCDEEQYTVRRDYELAWMFLKRKWPKDTFGKDQIAWAAELLHAARALTDTCDRLSEDLKKITGNDDGDYYEDYPRKFDPGRIEYREERKKNPEKRETAKKDGIHSRAQSTMEHYAQGALAARTAGLQEEKHTMETEIRSLRSRIRELEKKQRESEALLKEYENDRQELAALREHVYHFTQEDLVPEETDVKQMQAKLREKRIVILGGHSNWVRKLREIFPGWEYVKPEVSGAVNPHIVENADYVYFFTDTIGHSTYYRYIQILREKRIPFGYIHGVNIEANTAQIYRELKEKTDAGGKNE